MCLRRSRAGVRTAGAMLPDPLRGRRVGVREHGLGTVFVLLVWDEGEKRRRYKGTKEQNVNLKPLFIRIRSSQYIYIYFFLGCLLGHVIKNVLVPTGCCRHLLYVSTTNKLLNIILKRNLKKKKKDQNRV